MKNRTRHRPSARGFTLIEILVVVGIMGIFMVVSYPAIINVTAVRNLDNATREVQTYLHQAKLRAVDTKIVHRVRFHQPEGTFWAYEIERLQVDGTWVRVPGPPRKTVSRLFNVTVDLPVDGSNSVAIFSPLGSVANFTVDQNSIVLQSPKLDRPGQMDERVISLFMGGSIQYAKRKSS
jgi:prepilin-type N-terminal cleavage/methylation domain-containing protein